MLKVLQELKCPSPLAPCREAADDENEVKQLTPKKKAAKKKTKAKKPSKIGGSGGSKPAEKVELEAPLSSESQAACVYEAGAYRDAMYSFLRQARSAGCSPCEARAQWKASDARAKLLQNMSPAERKRRRFD